MAVEKCSRRVPPILKQCFMLGYVIDNSNKATTITNTSLIHPKANKCDCLLLNQSVKPLSSRLLAHGGRSDSRCYSPVQFNSQSLTLCTNQNNDQSVSSKDSKQTSMCFTYHPHILLSSTSHNLRIELSTPRPVIEEGYTKYIPPSNFKPSSAQLSFILLKLREEVSTVNTRFSK